MKILFLVSILVMSFSSLAEACSISLYMPGLQEQSADYQIQVKSVLKQKNYRLVESDYNQIDLDKFKGEFLLEFYTDGVFRIQEKAFMTLYKGKYAAPARYQDSKRTFGGDKFEPYLSLLKGLPACNR